MQAKVTTDYVGRWKFPDSKNAGGCGDLAEGKFGGNTDIGQLVIDHVSAFDGLQSQHDLQQ